MTMQRQLPSPEASGFWSSFAASTLFSASQVGDRRITFGPAGVAGHQSPWPYCFVEHALQFCLFRLQYESPDSQVAHPFVLPGLRLTGHLLPTQPKAQFCVGGGGVLLST